MRETREKCDGRLEFDVLVDGKYRNRVSEGILIESKPFGAALYMRCDKKTLFDALICLLGEVEKNDWSDEFEIYKKVSNVNPDNIDDLIRDIDAFFEKNK